MSVRLDGTLLRLEGDCMLEDAETVVGLLQAGGIRAADLSACGLLHAAVAQALVAFAVPVEGAPADPFVRDIVMPALATATGDKPRPID